MIKFADLAAKGSLVCRSASYASQRMASSATIKLPSEFKTFNADKGPNMEVTVTRDEALRMFTQMQMSRRMESAAGNLYKAQKVRGFCHLYSGEEGGAVGIKNAMDDNDAVITSYRCHSWTYLMLNDITPVLCELTGRLNGNVYGKGGSMHMYSKNYYGGNGIVGAQTPVGTGVALAMKMNKQKNVCYTLFGDGAASQGQLFEAMNIAKLWSIPVVYVCENNKYGFGTSTSRSSAAKSYYDRLSYMPGCYLDGMNVLAVREACRWAKEWCNAGKGPMFLELNTYRYSGHSVADPGTSYRTREEVEKTRKSRDPIMGFKEMVLPTGIVKEEELKQIEKEIKKTVDEAAKLAKDGPETSLDLLTTDLYHNTPPVRVRHRTEYQVQKYATSKEALGH